MLILLTHKVLDESPAPTPQAPILWICGITDSTAVVEVSCNVEGEVSIWNHIQIRGENGNETKAEWNDILFDWVNSNRLMITGLSPDSTYSVCGMYEVLESRVWSELSEPLTFTTKSRDD